jgi:NhaP-type Na+/H+ or K+/H+ antiporter
VSIVAVLICFALVLSTRALSVFLSGIVSDYLFPNLLTNKQKLVLWFSGFRGAVGMLIVNQAFAFGLKCLRHLNEKEAAHRIFSLVLFTTALTVVFKSALMQTFADYLGLKEPATETQYFAAKNGDESSGENGLTAPGKVLLTVELLKSDSGETKDVQTKAHSGLVRFMEGIFVKEDTDETIDKIKQVTQTRENALTKKVTTKDLKQKLFGDLKENSDAYQGNHVDDSVQTDEGTRTFDEEVYKPKTGKKKSKKEKMKDTFGL